MLAPDEARAVGESPQNPIVFDAASGSISLTANGATFGWLRVLFAASTSTSHLVLETQGGVDTTLELYANLAEAQSGTALLEDDDSGSGLNAAVSAPLGFPSPYLVRVTTAHAGTFSLRARLVRQATAVCNWPAECTVEAVASGQPTAAGLLDRLRRVRSEVLRHTERGRQLEALYWRLGRELVPPVLLDAELRRRVYQDLGDLLPLADEALASVRGVGGQARLTASQVERLHGLLELAASRVSPELAVELRERWSEFDLETKIGQTVSQALLEAGLHPKAEGSVTVLFKLRHEPRLELREGRTRLLGLEAGLQALLDNDRVGEARRLHEESPARLAAGLTRTMLVRVRGHAEAASLVASLRQQPQVEWAKLSASLYLSSASGQDPYRLDLWGLDAVRAPQAWATTTGSCSTRVAVVDTGLRSELADFQGKVLTSLGYDVVNDDPVPDDEIGHGTHVAGTIAAAVNNSTSSSGVAPGVCLIAIKVFGDADGATEEDIAEGIVRATDSGARVINLSLGCDCDVLQAVEEALEYAAAHNIVIVAATGNDSLASINYPASSVWTNLAVGAVNSQLAHASFSNTGQGIDVVAPGVGVVSLFPDGESCTGDGTSMATPHVAGVAAMVRSVNQTLSSEAVASIVRGNARDLGPPGFDSVYGAGLVDAEASVRAATGSPGAGCQTNPTAICLNNGRFRAEAFWRRPDGSTGQGQVVRLTPDTAYFWFFNPNNVEMFVKVLNACSTGNRFWVFAGGLTNIEVRLRITDTATGQVREYVNPQGTAFAPIQDTSAFATCSASASVGTESLEAPAFIAADLDHAWAELLDELPVRSEPQAPANAAACIETDTAMCVSGGRFRVDATWRRATGETGAGHAVRLTNDTGYFWFFSQNNVEMVVKVLNACSFSNRVWVFAGGLTNVEVRVRVTDTQTGQVKTYLNPQGAAFRPIQDTSAFATCP